MPTIANLAQSYYMTYLKLAYDDRYYNFGADGRYAPDLMRLIKQVMKGNQSSHAYRMLYQYMATHESVMPKNVNDQTKNAHDRLMEQLKKYYSF